MIAIVCVAIAVALLLGIGWRITRRPGALLVALTWGAYAVYEYLMYRRVLCSGECNIRVDLLLLFPLLAGGALWTAVAVVQHIRARRRGVPKPHNV
ncbi:MAG: hypothetical protein P3B98_03975 [Gemmatimonadota bacterium]|nr:hypothetical protein [Gemmatimonadota bacterium]